MNETGRSRGLPIHRFAYGTLAMKFICFLLFIAFAAAVTIFVVQNREDITLRYWDRNQTYPLPVVVAAIYVLGMLTGWTVVGLVKRSVRGMTSR